MRTIAHLSDLHFGADDPPVLAALERDLRALAPDLIVVSGDLTQRARRREFEHARAWLSLLRTPRVVVPGNHDVPLFDVARRFLSPLGRFQRFVEPDPYPAYEDEELLVLGLNTARSLTWKAGRISTKQIAEIRRRWRDRSPDALKVLVTHHPFVPAGTTGHGLVGRAPAALEALEEVGADLLLAGHHHRGFALDARHHHVKLKRSLLVAQAGTAGSRRRRGEPNAYNWVRVDRPRVDVEIRTFDGGSFTASRRHVFERDGLHWRPLATGI